MKRLMGWQPDPADADTRFVVEWDDEDPHGDQVCLEAVVKGKPSKKPQAAYEKALAANRAKNGA